MFSLNVEVSEARRQDLLREAEHARLIREARQDRRDAEAKRSSVTEHQAETQPVSQPNLQRQFAK